MFNFSRTEIRVILLLVLLLLIGSGMTLYRRYRANQSVDIVSVIEKSIGARSSTAADRSTAQKAASAGRETPMPGERKTEVIHKKKSFPKVNINTAGAYELEGLPGIGPVLARRIIEYREEHGSFKTLGQLLEVEGIGDKKLEAIRDYMYIE